MGIIHISNLSYRYKDNNELVLADINLTIKNGEFICIIGPSGCGKSTLLRILAGLALPAAGEVSIDQQLIRGPGTDRSVVFQHYSLFPWLTAKKNIKFGIQQAKKNLSKQQVEELAIEYLKKVGMEKARDKYPYQLSGGMQQRVAIARALAMDADILLLDEPFGAIDAKIRRGLQLLLESLWYCSEPKKTIVFVTHDIDEAIILADRIIFMRPGEIGAEIKIPYARPRRQKNFIKSESYQQLKNELRELFYLEAELAGNEELL